MKEITATARLRIPEDVVRYIQEFFCVCEICFHSEFKDNVIMCSECKRFWCYECRPIPLIIKNVYDPTTGKRIYICKWCIRETRISLMR